MTHREYFYTVDARGNLIHDGAIVDDHVFLDFFFKRVRANDTGLHMDYAFYAPCGSEWNFIACVDTPLVLQSMRDDQLYYSPSLSVPFNPASLRFDSNGILYHTMHVGGVARIVPTVAVELARQIEPWGPWFSYHDTTDSIREVIPPLHLPTHQQLFRPREGNHCVGCGRENQHGLKLSFLFDSTAQSVDAWFCADDALMGSLNIMHGGFVALLLDETMGKVLSGLNIKAPTAQLNVRYRQPVPIGMTLHLHAEIVRQEGRKNFVKGSIAKAAEPEKVLAEAEALFIRLSESHLNNLAAMDNVNAQVNT